MNLLQKTEQFYLASYVASESELNIEIIMSWLKGLCRGAFSASLWSRRCRQSL